MEFSLETLSTSTGEPSSFQYEPLSHEHTTRLLKLQSALVDGDLACTIEQFNRAEGGNLPKYHALSYCWGDPKPTKTIYLNDCAVKIHENLWVFLRLLWDSKMFDYFWTDCLSLNQQDKYEVGQQIPCMRHIYTQAENVFMFLGCASELEESLKCLLRWKNEQRRSQDVVDAARVVLSVPFWQRVWIIQEIVLASRGTILVGGFRAGFDKLLLKLERATKPSILPEPIPQFRYIFRIKHLRQPSIRKMAFLQLLNAFRDTYSTKPIDKVYGILSLVPTHITRELDVRSDKTAQQVFWDVVFVCWGTTTGFERIARTLTPMYSEDEPALYLKSLEAYSLDRSMTDRHREQAGITLSMVQALHVLASSYVSLDASQQPVPWRDAFNALFLDRQLQGSSINEEPEFSALEIRKRSQRLFSMAVDIALSTLEGKVLDTATSLHSGTTSRWKASRDCNEMTWSLIMEDFIIQPLDVLVTSCGYQTKLHTGVVYHFTGGRLGILMNNSSMTGKLCVELSEDQQPLGPLI
jgi:hypothetical protein